MLGTNTLNSLASYKAYLYTYIYQPPTLSFWYTSVYGNIGCCLVLCKEEASVFWTTGHPTWSYSTLVLPGEGPALCFEDQVFAVTSALCKGPAFRSHLSHISSASPRVERGDRVHNL